LSEALSYHDGLIEQGYTEEEAVEHTLRYFPDFSLDGRKPDPAPPPGFDFIPSESKPKDEAAQPLVDLDVLKFKAGKFFEKSRKWVKDNQKIVYSASGILVALVIIYMVFQIPASTHPIEGSWTKADGQIFEFNMDGTFDDGTGNDATWEIDGDELIIVSTVGDGDDATEIKQTLKQGFSDDEKAMWIKWVGLEINGEDASSEVENTCILVIKDSSSYSEDASKYISKRPSWCE